MEKCCIYCGKTCDKIHNFELLNKKRKEKLIADIVSLIMSQDEEIIFEVIKRVNELIE